MAEKLNIIAHRGLWKMSRQNRNECVGYPKANNGGKLTKKHFKTCINAETHTNFSLTLLKFKIISCYYE